MGDNEKKTLSEDIRPDRRTSKWKDIMRSLFEKWGKPRQKSPEGKDISELKSGKKRKEETGNTD